MTLPPNPTQFFSPLKGTHKQHTKANPDNNRDEELKMPTHSLQAKADEYQSSIYQTLPNKNSERTMIILQITNLSYKK